MDAGIDYRLRTLTQAHLYLTPLSPETDAEMCQMFSRLSGWAFSAPVPVLEINHRPMLTLSAGDGVLAIDFATLCLDARSQNDYIALSRLYHTVLLHNVTVMGSKEENAARRFLALVDEFYERRDQTGDRGTNLYVRAVSRREPEIRIPALPVAVARDAK